MPLNKKEETKRFIKSENLFSLEEKNYFAFIKKKKNPPVHWMTLVQWETQKLLIMHSSQFWQHVGLNFNL